METRIRQETPNDYPAVADVIQSAFQDVEYSNHREQSMVARLRNSEAFIPQLSLVAEVAEKIVAHILLTKIFIRNQEKSVASLALAPLSVVPEFQERGIGSTLVIEGHRLAKELGYESVVVLGHASYYPRFGYEQTKKYGIELPFKVRDENCMVVSLTEHGLSDVRGKVEYPSEFLE